MERDVYIGNGFTKTITINDKYVNYLDLEKLKNLIDENKDKKIFVGASGDWYFTAREITIDDYEQIIKGRKYFLQSSDWSPFHAEIDGEIIDVTLKIPKNISYLIARKSFYDGIDEIETWFHGLFHECIKKLSYEEIKNMQKDINPIVDKYKNIANCTATTKGGER